MGRKNKQLITWFWTIFVLGMLAFLGWFRYYSNKMRVAMGYFSDPYWITMEEISGSIFFWVFAAVAGFIVVGLIKKTIFNKYHKR